MLRAISYYVDAKIPTKVCLWIIFFSSTSLLFSKILLKFKESDLLLTNGEGGQSNNIESYLIILISWLFSSFGSIKLARSKIFKIISDETAKSILLWEVRIGAQILTL